MSLFSTAQTRMRPAFAITAAVLVTGLSLTIAAAYWLQRDIHAEAQSRFERQVELVESDIQRRMTQPIYGLKGARGVFAASKAPVNRSAFRAYVESRNLPAEFPGVRGFGFAQRVMRQDLERFIAAERLDEAPDFAVRTSGAAPDLYVIKFIEPIAINRAAWGLDMGAETVRRQAIESAIRSGEATLSSRIVLVQDGKQGPGFLYLLPVYRNGTDPTNFRQSEAALLGLLTSPVVVAEILGHVVDISNGQISVELFDGDATNASNLVFNSAEPLSPTTQIIENTSNTGRMFVSSRTLVIGDRPLTLVASSSPAFEAALDRSTPVFVGIGGALLSVLLALSVWLMATGRARAQALAQSMTADLERLAQVVQYTSNVVLIMDPQQRITWVNDGFTRSYGYTLEEATGRKPNDLLGSGKTDPSNLQLFHQSVAAGQGCRLEVLNRAKNGQELWIDLDVQPIHDGDGTLTGFMEIGLDITHRKQAEEQLRTSKAFLDRAEQIAGVGGWEVDLRSKVLTWSAQMYRIYELAPGDMPPLEKSLKFFAPEERRLIERTMQESIRQHTSWDLQLPLMTNQGRPIWVRSIGAYEFDKDKPIRLFGTLQDVTAQRAMEEELRRSNAMMQSIVDNLPCGLSVFDANLRLVAHNMQFRRLLDLPDALFSGRVTSFESIIRHNAVRGEYGEGDVDNIVARIVERSRQPTVHQFERLRHDGIPIEVRGAPMPGGGFVTTYMDITERKKVERLQGEFISTVSHELRTPLTSIFGSLSLLASGVLGKLPPEGTNLIKIALQNSERLIRLINDILDLEKIESRQMSFNMTVQPLAPLIVQAIEATQSYARQYGIQLEFESRLDDVMVQADSDRIGQVLLNLLSNAIKFSHPEGTVSVRMARVENRVRVSVVDRGLGIAEEFRSRIFQRFSQEDGSDKRQKGGSGLGLNICKSIVEAHQGHIDYSSGAGQGSEFFFELPLASRQ